ncbi:MAG: TonB-dependent receptor, partial [Haliea sp.]
MPDSMNQLPSRPRAPARRLQPSLLASAVLLAMVPSLHAQTGEPASARTLDTVVITASGSEQDIKQAPASITVITREELASRAFRDLTDVMRDVEGAAVTGAAAQQGGGGSDISLRGMPASYTLILIDGKRTNTREARTNGNGGYEAGWLPPIEAIERIEIIRGPMSSLYGSDAMGGVINVITRKVAREWTGSLRAEGTFQDDARSGDTLGTNFYLSGPIRQDLLGLSFYGGYLDREEDRINNGFNGAENYSLNGRLSLTPNRNHDIVLDFGRSRQDSTWHRGRSVLATTASAESVNQRDNVSLTHTGRWGRLGTSTVSVYGEEAFRSNYNLETNADPGAPNVLRNTVIDGKWTVPVASHLVTVGGQRRKEDFTASNYVTRVCRDVAPFVGCPVGTPNNGTYYQAVTVADAQLSTTTDALFVEDEWSITDKLTLTGGLRLDDHEVFGKEWTPRVYAVYNLTPGWTVKGGVSKGYKAPSARDILPGFALSSGGGNGGGSVVIRSNPDLQP